MTSVIFHWAPLNMTYVWYLSLYRKRTLSRLYVCILAKLLNAVHNTEHNVPRLADRQANMTTECQQWPSFSAYMFSQLQHRSFPAKLLLPMQGHDRSTSKPGSNMMCKGQKPESV